MIRLSAALRGVHLGQRLTVDSVRYIRTSPLGCKALARELGVSVCAVRKARAGHTWKAVQ